MPFYSNAGGSSSGLDAAGAVAAVVAASPVNISVQGAAARTFSLQAALSDVVVGMAASPSAGQVLTALSAGEAEWQTPAGALTPGVVPDLLTVGMPLLGSWWGNAPLWNGTTMVTSTSLGFGWTLFGPLAIAADPIGIRVDSVAAPYQGCGWYNLGTAETSLDHRPWIRGRVKPSATVTDQGVFVGWSAPAGPFGPGAVIAVNTLVLMVDNAGGPYADTTWKIRSRAAGAVTEIDTAVPYTASHDYEVYLSADATTVTWAIYDRTAGIAYGAAGVANANPPAATTGLGTVYYGMSGASAVSLRLTWGPCTRGHFGPA